MWYKKRHSRTVQVVKEASMKLETSDLSTVLREWYAKGSVLEIPGTASTRVWRRGTGPTVVCLHGVPTSAYLYRKVLPALESRGLEEQP